MSESKWKWWTSNSWKRLVSSDGTNVLYPYVCSDGHPDVNVSDEHMKIIAAAPEMLAELERLAEHFGWPETHPACQIIKKATS